MVQERIKSVAFLGLGVMGFPMAGHLVHAGYKVTVYNRNPDVAKRWCESYAGVSAATPALAVKNADVVCVCVGNDNDVRSVVLGDDGALSAMREGSSLIDHTTTSADLARELNTLATAQAVRFLDAPVSGGQAGAQNGKLTIMVGGDPDAFVRIEPVLEVYAQKVARMGSVGSGQLAKMANQICIAGLVQGLSEAMNFADLAGLDVEAVVDVISKGAAQSWQMENRYQTMLEKHYDHGFAVDWMRKDLGYVMQEAKNLGAEVPVTEVVDQYYEDVQALGGGRWDTSSLLARLHARRNT